MGKRKPVSILKRELQAATPKPHSKSAKRQRTSAPQHPTSAPHSAARRALPASQDLWRAASQLHQQAAHAVGRLLHADATGRNGATLKTLTLAPHVANKKALYAVTVETLKHVPVLRLLLERSGLAERHPQLPAPLAYVLVRDLLWGEGLRSSGPAEIALLDAADELRAQLEQMLREAGARDAAGLLPAAAAATAAAWPRTARVNTLTMSVREALAWLRSPPPAQRDAAWAVAGQRVEVDDLILGLLNFPPGSELHDHPLVAAGALVLQSKASCMTAAALAPRRGWRVLDACAAPGNKTTQLAAMMHGAGGDEGAGAGAGAKRSVIAVDKDPARLKRLRRNASLAGAGALVDARCADFLRLDPAAPEFADVRAVLLDPSCSGSGTALSRMDHLLPSAAKRAVGTAAIAYSDARVEALAAFQQAALRHALRFPGVERVAYSTCSLHAAENEGVVGAVLDEARAAGFELEAALPGWARRGVAWGTLRAEDAAKLLRTDPDQDCTDGFFVALFVRQAGRGGGVLRRGADDAGAGCAIARKRKAETATLMGTSRRP